MSNPKTGKVNTLLSLMEEKADMFSINNDDETAENIRRSISYLKGLPSDNDRLAFVESTPDFVGWMTSNFVGDDEGEKSIKEALDDKSEKVKLYERDEQGNRVLSRKELFEVLGLDDKTSSLAFDPASEDSWFRKSKPELQQIAASLGVSYPSLVNAYANESYKQGREKAIDDGSAGAFFVRQLFPRITESAKAGREISAADIGLDIGDKVLYALPFSTGVKAITKAGRIASNIGKVAFAPFASETADAIAYNVQEANGGDKNERSNFSVKDAAVGTAANFALGRIGNAAKSGLSSFVNYVKNSAKEEKKLLTPQEAYSLGMKAYDRFNQLVEIAAKNKGVKEFGSLKNVSTFLNKSQNEEYNNLLAKNISENAALNKVVMDIAKFIAENPDKKIPLQEISKKYWASLTPAKRKEIYNAIESNAEEGIRMFENNGGIGYIFNRKKVPLATDQFKKYAEGSPLGEVYKGNYRVPKFYDGAVARTGSEIKNIIGSNKTLNERIVPSAVGFLGEKIDELKGESESVRAEKKRAEMKRRQAIWVKKMQDDYKKAMGN